MLRGASGWESMVSSWQESIVERDAANMYMNLFMTVRLLVFFLITDLAATIFPDRVAKRLGAARLVIFSTNRYSADEGSDFYEVLPEE